MTEQYSRPSKLLATDECAGFDSGESELDEWIERYALVNQRSGMSTVFVSRVDDRIAGYYALATGGVDPASAPRRVTKGLPGYPVPVIILARLAVDRRDQGTGLGRALLGDALRRVENAAGEVGVRALLIHAKSVAARDFYLHHGEFEPAPTDPLHLFLLMKDLRKALNP